MTLVMTAGIGSLFTVMTSDERVAFSVGDKLIPTKEKLIKAHQLNDAVLFGWGGDYDTALSIKDMLSKMIKPQDTLKECKHHLEKVTDEIEINRNVAIILTGFYADGSSGMVMKKNNHPVDELKMKQLEYRYIMFPPTGDYSDRQDELLYIPEFTPDNIQEQLPKLGVDAWFKQSIEIAVNHLIKLHGIISYKEQEATTCEGYYYLVYKDTQGILRTVSGSYNTSQIHEQLKSKEEVN